MPASILERHEAEELAIRMARYTLPTSVIQLATGLPRDRTHQIFREIQGRSPRSGMMQETPTICRSGLMGIEVSLLVEVYRSRVKLDAPGHDDKLEARYLLDAYDWYVEYRRSAALRPDAEPLTPTQAYVVIRDWRAHMLERYVCGSCGFHSYYHVNAERYCYPCASERSAVRHRG